MIDTDTKLADYLLAFREAPWVALDTEADSLHAYPEKVCLIQLATVQGEVLVDPLAGLDLKPLFAALASHEIIIHGADYDLRLLRKHHGFVPSRIFDTMLASRLLGHRQFGLTHLVEHYLGRKLEKGSQKADWARRPLTERMERYALADVAHLKPLADALRAGLVAQGRLEWHREWCAQEIAEAARPAPPDPNLEWRIKGSHALAPPALAVLRELWRWRETEALAANRPPFFILSHEIMVSMAADAAGADHFQRWIPERFSPRRRTALLDAVQRGLAVPPVEQPVVLQPVRHRPSEAQMRRYREMEKRRDARAHQLKIDSTVIASRPMLSRLAENWTTHAAGLMRWQRELLQGAAAGAVLTPPNKPG